MESFNMTSVVVLPFCLSDNDALCTLLYIFLASLTVFTVFGNLLVIISIFYFKQLHTPTNFLILSLAVADLLIGAVIFPLNMTYNFNTCLVIVTLPCVIRSTIDYIISIASILNMCCISVDRYYAVCHPLLYKSKITNNAALMMCLGSWVLSMFYGTFYVALGITYDSCQDTCVTLLLLLGALTFYPPTVALLCVYAKIFLVAQRQARSIQNANSQFGATVSKMERKATKTLTIVMGLFLFCWAPLLISHPFNILNNHAIENIMMSFYWFALSNSMFNPFIYAFFYRWFRSASRMIISGKIFQGNFANTTLH